MIWLNILSKVIIWDFGRVSPCAYPCKQGMPLRLKSQIMPFIRDGSRTRLYGRLSTDLIHHPLPAMVKEAGGLPGHVVSAIVVYSKVVKPFIE